MGPVINASKPRKTRSGGRNSARVAASIRALQAQFATPGRSPSAELIAERRQEARRE